MNTDVKSILNLPGHMRVITLLKFFGIEQLDIVAHSKRSTAMVSNVCRCKDRNIFVETAAVDLLNEKGAGVTIEDLWPEPVKRRAEVA